MLGGAKDRTTNRPIGGSPVLAAHIERFRQAHPGAVVLLDGGDAMQGSALSNLVRGRSVIEVMNAMGYDAMAVGNHEFDWGRDTLYARMRQAKFPMLSANIYYRANGNRVEWTKPYTIIERGGVKIGVIGITTTSASYTTLPTNVADLEFRDPVPVLNALIPEVRAKGAQAIVVLAHEGGQQKKDGTIDGPIAELASGVPDVDAVFGGHSHTWVSGRVGTTPVVISSSNGRAIGTIRLDVDDATGRVNASEPKLESAFSDSIAPDEAVAAIVARYEKSVGPALTRVVATAASDITRDSPEQPLGCLMADVIRRAGAADIGMQNSGGVRAEIPAGPITTGKVYEVAPFDNLILSMPLTGAQVRKVLEEALAADRTMQVSGIRYSFDEKRPAGNRLTSVVLDSGAPFDTAATYTLATNDFIVGGGDGIQLLKTIEDVTNTNVLVRDALQDWFEAETAAGRQITPPAPGRIHREGER
jgi:2',3'-cyclic-nucleotide 2'-phosphodiesterase/3'-nucleotidase